MARIGSPDVGVKKSRGNAYLFVGRMFGVIARSVTGFLRVDLSGVCSDSPTVVFYSLLDAIILLGDAH